MSFIIEYKTFSSWIPKLEYNDQDEVEVKIFFYLTLAVPSTEAVARKLLLDGKYSIERIHVLWPPG